MGASLISSVVVTAADRAAATCCVFGGRSFLKLHEKTADHADCAGSAVLRAWKAVGLLRAIPHK